MHNGRPMTWISVLTKPTVRVPSGQDEGIKPGNSRSRRRDQRRCLRFELPELALLPRMYSAPQSLTKMNGEKSASTLVRIWQLGTVRPTKYQKPLLLPFGRLDPSAVNVITEICGEIDFVPPRRFRLLDSGCDSIYRVCCLEEEVTYS